MSEYIKKYSVIPAILIFVGLPFLLLWLGDFPDRSLLKDGISLLVLLAFFLMLGQFFLIRRNRTFIKGLRVSKAIKFHKWIGYLFVTVLLVHPFLVVVPRYFESGIAPGDAFITLITTFDNSGIVIGMIAWVSMLILGTISLLRKKLVFQYKTWRIIHGVLSMLFISLASWHAIDLGRHTNLVVSTYIIVLAAGGVLMLVASYLLKTPVKKG